ncbi:MAG: plasmid transfer protein TraB [Frankiales bacterium]|nr:plasmid transfer protein TraB [Frankiales bacterium]
MSDIAPANEAPANEAAPEPAGDSTPDSAPAAPPARPIRPTAAGVVEGTLNFITLAARTTALTVAAAHLKEGMSALQRHMEGNATKARTLSEMCDQAEVDPQYTAQILEVSQALQRVAAASGELADTADQMEANARGFNDAHESEYRGIYEVVQAGQVRQPKPGFNAVR